MDVMRHLVERGCSNFYFYCSRYLYSSIRLSYSNLQSVFLFTFAYLLFARTRNSRPALLSRSLCAFLYPPPSTIHYPLSEECTTSYGVRCTSIGKYTYTYLLRINILTTAVNLHLMKYFNDI